MCTPPSNLVHPPYRHGTWVPFWNVIILYWSTVDPVSSMDILGRPKEIANCTKFSTIMYKGISPKCIRIISAKQLSDILSLVIPFTPLLQEKLPAFQERGMSYSHPAVAHFCSQSIRLPNICSWGHEHEWTYFLQISRNSEKHKV